MLSLSDHAITLLGPSATTSGFSVPTPIVLDTEYDATGEFGWLERPPDGVTMTVHGASGEASRVKGGPWKSPAAVSGSSTTAWACETEQAVDGVPVLTATRARGTWRPCQHASARVVGGFRTFEDVWAYVPRLLADAA